MNNKKLKLVNKGKVSDLSKWKHTLPKKYYIECVKMFGKPNAISNTEGGMCIWYDQGDLFSEHILRDEQVEHCVPRPHQDYFYSSILFYVPSDKLLDVLKISGSLNYDGLKKLLTARCGGINANYATLYLAMQVANGDLSISQVKSDDMYSKMIRGEIMPHSEMAQIMIDMKRTNNKMYMDEIGYDYATYAFKGCYEEGSITNSNNNNSNNSNNKYAKVKNTKKGNKKRESKNKKSKNTLKK
jgi:hypothetical protein